jgi:hypothetical protein
MRHPPKIFPATIIGGAVVGVKAADALALQTGDGRASKPTCPDERRPRTVLPRKSGNPGDFLQVAGAKQPTRSAFVGYTWGGTGLPFRPAVLPVGAFPKAHAGTGFEPRALPRLRQPVFKNASSWQDRRQGRIVQERVKKRGREGNIGNSGRSGANKLIGTEFALFTRRLERPP